MRVARRARAVHAATAILAITVCALARVPGARAGEWMQVACANPTGSAAGSQGWTGALIDTSAGASATTTCGPGAPMAAVLGDAVPQPVGSGAALTYTPPPGSIVVGGRLAVSLQAPGGGTDATATAVVDEPGQAYPTDVRPPCAGTISPCAAQGTSYSGTVTLPANLGGQVTVAAGCAGSPGFSCDAGGRDGAWAQAQVSAADVLLSTGARPGATQPSGSLLHHPAHGTARLRVDATDPGGPGVHLVTAAIDGRVVRRLTPDPNGGACLPVGTDHASGALMFDAAQPCPASVVTTLAIPTRGLPDGDHRLTLTVTDAAGDTAMVLRRTILTANPRLTPQPRGALRARFSLSTRWAGPRTTLRSVTPRALPRAARVRVSCAGAGCPRLSARAEPAARVGVLLRALRGRVLRAGDRLLITVTAPGRDAEAIAVTIRSGRAPRLRLVPAAVRR